MPDIIINYVIFSHATNIDEQALLNECGSELDVLVFNDTSQWKVPGHRFRMAVSMHKTREVVWVEVQSWNGNSGSELLIK